jgi:hypothetical protein
LRLPIFCSSGEELEFNDKIPAAAPTFLPALDKQPNFVRQKSDAVFGQAGVCELCLPALLCRSGCAKAMQARDKIQPIDENITPDTSAI